MKVAWGEKKENLKKSSRKPQNEFAEEEISIAFVARRKCLMHCAVKIPIYGQFRTAKFDWIFHFHETRRKVVLWNVKRGKSFSGTSFFQLPRTALFLASQMGGSKKKASVFMCCNNFLSKIYLLYVLNRIRLRIFHSEWHNHYVNASVSSAR